MRVMQGDKTSTPTHGGWSTNDGCADAPRTDDTERPGLGARHCGAAAALSDGTAYSREAGGPRRGKAGTAKLSKLSDSLGPARVRTAPSGPFNVRLSLVMVTGVGMLEILYQYNMGCGLSNGSADDAKAASHHRNIEG